MSNYTSLITYIKTLLEGITQLNKVYAYEETQIEGYPAATISISDTEVEEMDTGFNFRTYGFTIRIYQEISEAGLGTDEGERIMRALIDAVILKFDQDITLGDNCIMCKPVPIKAGYLEKENNVRAADLVLKCLVKIDRTP